MKENPVTRAQLSLDDLYHMTAHIYGDQNIGRTPESTFTHFIEVCGMLSALDKRKPRGEANLEDALCKALGWFFPLMAHFRVRSLRSLIFRKYPRLCPYCRRDRHVDKDCKAVKGMSPGMLDHEALRNLARQRQNEIPVGLNDWQNMFMGIYERTSTQIVGRSTLGLMEETGELAEAIRVYDRYPQYFAGEAADVFSYLMGLANDYSIREEMDGKPAFNFERAFLQRYPGRCVQCGYSVCNCPRIPQATVGRMAKELPLDDNEQLFAGTTLPRPDAAAIAERVFEELGGFKGQIEKEIPFDRGETLTALVRTTMELAERLKDDHPEFADSLQRNAVRLIKSATGAGEKRHSEIASETIRALTNILTDPSVDDTHGQQFDRQLQNSLSPRPALSVLLVLSSPANLKRLSVDNEARHIILLADSQMDRERLTVDPLLAARIDDVRGKLNSGRRYNLLHFAGHADDGGLQMHDLLDQAEPWPFESIADYAETFGVECLVLNACDTAAIASATARPLTIAMSEAISDRAAIQFAIGFYEALKLGRDITLSFEEGMRAVKAHSLTISAKIYPAVPGKVS